MYTRTHVVERGRRWRRWRRDGLDGLSTYGALQEWGQAFVLTLCRKLESAGYLRASGGEYPMVTLTEAGVQMMKSGGSLRLNWP